MMPLEQAMHDMFKAAGHQDHIFSPPIHLLTVMRQGERIIGKRVVIETEECIGCESCVELCPEVFGFDEDAEKAFVLKPEGGLRECPEECIDEAIESCPVECIHWE